MALSLKDIRRSISWVRGAINAAVEVAKTQPDRLGEFIADCGKVLNAFDSAFKALIPENAMDPFPKNFFNRLKWAKRHGAALNKIIANAGDITKPAREQAAQTAAKWNWQY